ncbi:MAG: flavodoxin family protein [Dehalococcoidia bacterium]|jgi:multimeric flavodoxin WrbA
MKVLGINGSPRRGGNTDLLLAEIMKGAQSKGAETKILVLNDLDIKPCQHCDACFEAGVCRYKDDMQTVYKEMEKADAIVMATPIHFLAPTAQMKAAIDRCQSLWARKYILEKPPLGDDRPRKGLFVAVGGMKLAHLFEPSLATIKALFKVLNIDYAGELLFPAIDEKGAVKNHPDALTQAFAAGRKLAEA